MQLMHQHVINGSIKCVTGLHIGGASAALDIGGLDTPVIKTPNGVPYIPGSSLKGKLRTLLARKINGAVEPEKDSPVIKQLFGTAGSDQEQESSAIPGVTRLKTRDAVLDTDAFEKDFADAILETDYTEGKFENKINRSTGTAQNPRQIERVPAGAQFNFELVLDIYDVDQDERQKPDGVEQETAESAYLDLLSHGFNLLQNDYLGGNGTRGYGQVAIHPETDPSDL